MRGTPALVPLAAAALLLAGCAASVPRQVAAPPTAAVEVAKGAVVEENVTPVIGSVLDTPRAVPTTDGRVHIAYELYLDNVTTQKATVESVDVLDENGSSLERLDGDDVTPWIRVYGATEPGRVLGPGQGALVWLDVVVDSMDDLPASLDHDVTIGFDPGAPPIIPNLLTSRLASTDVDATPAVVISPPLEGEGWLNGNSCCALTPHRSAVNPLNGGLHVPERYAIDYIRLDGAGSFRTGPADQLESYPYFGENILAVGDGPIVSMRSDLPEQTPGADPTGLALDEYGGNHIVQDLGDGVYAFYAHLQPGNPLGVEVGQELGTGEAIGLLGNTGNTDAPHLHFHLMDSPSPLGSNGVPFVYDSFEVTGDITPEDLDAKVDAGGPFSIDTTDARTAEDLYPIWLTVSAY